MSMNPNDPFQQRADAQGGAGPNQHPEAPRRSGMGCLMGCGIAGIVMVLVCCGGGFMMVRFGMSAYAEMIQQQVEGDPVIVEYIGEINSLDFDWSSTIEQMQEAEGGEAQVSFLIEGSKGSGTLVVEQAGGNPDEVIESATLILSTGDRIPLELGNAESRDDEDFELDFDIGESSDNIEVLESTEEAEPN